MRRGFTLAEVLLTLGIIGVVAAVTLPSLQHNVGKNIAQTQFMKAVNTIQNANDAVMADKGEDIFWRACGLSGSANMNSANYMNCISPYLRGYQETVNNITGADVSLDAGLDSALKIKKDYKVFNTKDGISIISAELQPFNGIKKDENGNYQKDSNGNYISNNDNKYYMETVYVDLNGLKNPPNALSKDIFVLVTNLSTGELIGWGSKQFVYILNKNLDHPGYSYWNAGRCDSTSALAPAYCSGSIIDNGGKIIYPWE